MITRKNQQFTFVLWRIILTLEGDRGYENFWYSPLLLEQAGICLGSDSLHASRWTQIPTHPYEDVVVVRYDHVSGTMTIVPEVNVADTTLPPLARQLCALTPNGWRCRWNDPSSPDVETFRLPMKKVH
jgi:hypothetical protein